MSMFGRNVLLLSVQAKLVRSPHLSLGSSLANIQANLSAELLKGGRYGATVSESPLELIDVVDPATGNRIETRSRAEVHAEGLWHQVFHCMVIRRSARSIVLQQRSRSKMAFPGRLDLSVTGHLEAGESPTDGIREAEEELGVTLEASALVALGTRLLADDNGEGKNRERINLFFLADERPIEAYDPPVDEVAGLVEIEIDSFLAALLDPDLVVDVVAMTAGAKAAGRQTFSRNDLVEGTAGYWVVLAVMAGRFADGDEPIGI